MKPRNAITRVLRIVAAISALALVGCGGGRHGASGPPPQLAADAPVDGASRARLATLDHGETVLLSVRTVAGRPGLDTTAVGARPLGRRGATQLMTIGAADLARLTRQSDLMEIVVWGAGDAVSRLDPMLRQSMLAAVAGAERHATTLSVIANFGRTADPVARLRAHGITARSVAGRVATFDADLETLFGLLADPGVTMLSLPATQRPSIGR